MFALYHRDVGGGKGQFIDLSLYEPMFQILRPQPLQYDQLGVVRNAWATVPEQRAQHLSDA